MEAVSSGAQIVNALQSIVARNVDSLESAVVSICMFQAGNTDNVTPRKLGPYCTPIHNLSGRLTVIALVTLAAPASAPAPGPSSTRP